MKHLIPQGQDGTGFVQLTVVSRVDLFRKCPPEPASAAGQWDVQGMVVMHCSLGNAGIREQSMRLHPRESEMRRGRGGPWYKCMLSNPKSEEAFGWRQQYSKLGLGV